MLLGGPNRKSQEFLAEQEVQEIRSELGLFAKRRQWSAPRSHSETSDESKVIIHSSLSQKTGFSLNNPFIILINREMTTQTQTID